MIGTKLAAAALALTAGLVGCASPDPARLGPGSDARGARRTLAAAAASGPVRLEVNGLPAPGGLARPALEAEAARGVRGLDVRFGQPPEAAGAARLLLLFDPPPGASSAVACNAAGGALPAPRPEAGGTRLQAVFCDGGALVADATAATPGRDAAAVARLIWRATGRLFPDDYPDTYGFGLLGNRVGVGGAGGY